LLLGPQWTSAIPLVQTLSLMSVFIALAHGGGYLLLTLGKVRLLALVTWIQFALLLLLALVAFPASTAAGIASMRLAVALAGMALLLAIVLRVAPFIRLGDLIGGAWRPASGALVLTVALHLTEFPPTLWAGWTLLAEIALGAVVYGLTVLALWRLSGCGEGAEAFLLEKSGMDQRVRRMLGAHTGENSN
jgi:O-antigen/teichoic acid export membrane protein